MAHGNGAHAESAHVVAVRPPATARVLVAAEERGPRRSETLVEAGKVTPVIDRTYPLSEVPDAMRYLEQQHPGGKLVITM